MAGTNETGAVSSMYSTPTPQAWARAAVPFSTSTTSWPSSRQFAIIPSAMASPLLEVLGEGLTRSLRGHHEVVEVHRHAVGDAASQHGLDSFDRVRRRHPRSFLLCRHGKPKPGPSAGGLCDDGAWTTQEGGT